MKYKFFCDCLSVNYRSFRHFINNNNIYPTYEMNAEQLSYCIAPCLIKRHAERVSTYKSLEAKCAKRLDDLAKFKKSRIKDDQNRYINKEDSVKANVLHARVNNSRHRLAFLREEDFLLRNFGTDYNKESEEKIIDYACEVLAKYGVESDKIRKYAREPGEIRFTPAFQAIQNRTEKRTKARAKM